MTAGQIFSTPITRSRVAELADAWESDWIKAVVDVAQGVMAIGGDLHADDEALLLARGSRQEDLWGINLYPGEDGPGWIEFDAMINIRPRDGNRSRGVDDPERRAQIRRVVESLVVAGEE